MLDVLCRRGKAPSHERPERFEQEHQNQVLSHVWPETLGGINGKKKQKNREEQRNLCSKESGPEL